MKKVILILLLAVANYSVYAQSSDKACCPKKAGCSPEACGPKDTKVSESEAITNLRAELQGQLSLLNKLDFDYMTYLKDYEIPQGNNDESSLMIIMATIQAIKSQLAKNVPEQLLIAELEKTSTEIPEGKRQTMIYLMKETKLISEQIQKLQ